MFPLFTNCDPIVKEYNYKVEKKPALIDHLTNSVTDILSSPKKPEDSP